ncbi:Cell division organizing protein PopZ [hydrothermal vent metagenome]|uniref:Cell division organizing protein PopZ n=1 Tax=hydrothermal vent metagenome TaxID=652676 RepID=A0A3B0RRJ0_9ZZZZ
MSETEGQEEPTMEEILASIRKIISEDDVEEGEEDKVTEPEPEPEPEPEAVVEPEPEPDVDIELEEDDQVLELTEEVEEEPEPEVEPEVKPEPEVEPEPVAATAPEMAIDDVDPADEEDVLMSDESTSLAMDQFGVLSELLTTGYQGAGNTLEDLVREMLKPMLKVWLDKNLPPIVERMIAKEIARLARTKKP